MKKKLLSAGLFMMGVASLNAQIFSESFDTSIPGTWTIIDVDGLVSTTSQSAYASWAWNSGMQDASSSSWYNNSGAGPTNDWLITPPITIPMTGSFRLKYTGSSHEASYLEEYSVKLSTTGTAVGDFTTNLASIVNEPFALTDHTINLPALAGQTIYIAFQHTSMDESMLHIDNVVVEEMFADDIMMVSLNVAPVIVAGNYSITGSVKNNGANPITSFDLSWDSGSGANNATITTTIAPGATYNFTHTTPLVAVAGTDYDLDVCATVTGDGDVSNNCMSASTSAATQAGTRLALMEEFSSSTCPPCFTLNTTGFGGIGMNTYLANANANAQSGADLAVIKYQVNWPGAGDHAFNADVNTRVGYYGINAAPTVLVDANEITSPAEVTTASNVPAYMDISATHSNTGGVLTVSVQISPYASWSGAKLFIAVLDKEYAAGSDASFSNGETEFHHIFRKMVPNASGTTINLTSGTPYTGNQNYTYSWHPSYPAQGSFALHADSEQEVVVFVQDADGNILNSAISIGELASVENSDVLTGFSVYPNPATDMANVEFNVTNQSDVTVQVLNTLGQIVYTNYMGEVNGTQKVQLNTAQFETGVYLVNISVNGTVVTKRISVTK